jgi:hypothetical protein
MIGRVDLLKTMYTETIIVLFADVLPLCAGKGDVDAWTQYDVLIKTFKGGATSGADFEFSFHILSFGWGGIFSGSNALFGLYISMTKKQNEMVRHQRPAHLVLCHRG